jgi:hypothetical protein
MAGNNFTLLQYPDMVLVMENFRSVNDGCLIQKIEVSLVKKDGDVYSAALPVLISKPNNKLIQLLMPEYKTLISMHSFKLNATAVGGKSGVSDEI